MARKFGFAGGLVPGVTLFAYLARPVAEVLGAPWLAGGRMDAKFVAPVYEGESVTGTYADDGTLALTKDDGQPCVTGGASLGTGPPLFPLEIPEAQLPRQRPAAGPDSLAPGTVLGSVAAGRPGRPPAGWVWSMFGWPGRLGEQPGGWPMAGRARTRLPTGCWRGNQRRS